MDVALLRKFLMQLGFFRKTLRKGYTPEVLYSGWVDDPRNPKKK